MLAVFRVNGDEKRKEKELFDSSRSIRQTLIDDEWQTIEKEENINQKVYSQSLLQ